MQKTDFAAESGWSSNLLGMIVRTTMMLLILGAITAWGAHHPTSTSVPLAWAEERSVTKAENGKALENRRPGQLRLAKGCPAGFTDGDPNPPDINILSCHTELVECQPGESPIACGKRALMAGDWETAVRAFERAPDDSGEAIYGRYLARLFRLYADYNNMFFRTVLGENFNQVHLTRDLNTPSSRSGLAYIGHYVCLANRVYFPGINQYLRQQRSIEKGTSFIDKYLEKIVEGKYTLTGLDGGPLPIRWVQGRCIAPLLDGVFRGIWDWVDAVMIYQHLFGSPAETKRFDIGLVTSESSKKPCNADYCDPDYTKDDLQGNPVKVPRLSDDSEWFLGLLIQASQSLFDPGRFLPGQEPVFFWRDTNENGTVDASDGFTIQLYKTGTREPILALEDATLGARWIPRQADPPVNPAPVQPFVFCPNGQSSPDCFVHEGEQALEEPVPVWLQLLLRGLKAQPSPDGTKLLFGKKVTQGNELHLFVTDNALDEAGTPKCSEPKGDCCLTCKVVPEGIRIANGGGFFAWIPDPANPQGPARGIFYMNNDHPSAWGWGGQAMGTQFFAIRPDGIGNSRLLEGVPPFALHYQFRISPDGSQLLWASTWDPASGRASTHTLLLADIVTDERGFRLENVHSVIPVRDHGWYETGDFALDYPNDPRIFFTSSSLSMQSPRVFAATLTPEGIINEVFKLTYPTEVFSEPFKVDFHPGWYEFPRPLDHGRQVIFFVSDPAPVAADRYDRFLTFPPYLEGVLFGLTIFDIRFSGLDGDLGYLDAKLAKESAWIANIDGTNRRSLESVLQPATDAGWSNLKRESADGQIFLIQLNQRLRKIRFVVLRPVE